MSLESHHDKAVGDLSGGLGISPLNLSIKSSQWLQEITKASPHESLYRVNFSLDRERNVR